MKKISIVPFSNPIPTNELFIHQTFIRKAKAKGLTESEAESIDAVERALLNTNKEALVQAISQHLEGISKKKPKTGSR